LINWEGAAILVDIGPGTVTKLVEKGLSTSSLQGILVSHSHIDHFWDLVPLLWLRHLRNQRKRLKIICPRSDVPLMEWCTKVSQTDHPVEICGLEAGGETRLGKLVVKSFSANHETSKQPLGFTITEEPKKKLATEELTRLGVPKEAWRKLLRGKVPPNLPGELSDYVYQRQRRVVYAGDSRPTKELLGNAEKADLLIVESTYADDRARGDALRSDHMTVGEALDLALSAKVKNALLTHFSMRYSVKAFQESVKEFVRRHPEAPKVFMGEKVFTV